MNKDKKLFCRKLPASCSLTLITLCSLVFILSSCSKMGYGILLWSTEEPPISSGTVLPVYIRSNIQQLWVVGVPDELILFNDGYDKTEVPLSRLEFVGSRRKALARAEAFLPYALLYAENLQDGLPIRANPDNISRRVYRLRAGDIIKILEKVDGIPPVGTTGEPLPGDWFKVLTQDGVTGYCFSFRLRIFDFYDSTTQTVIAVQDELFDPDLDHIFSQTWSPEIYQEMISSREINVREFERKYHFDPGQETGRARIFMPDIDRVFAYERITSSGARTWRFEGTDLVLNLRDNHTISLQFTGSTGLMRTVTFVALGTTVDDIILQENARRQNLFMEIYNEGPVFSSSNYGSIAFSPNGVFSWTDFDALVPRLIPEGSSGEGRVFLDLYINPSFANNYDGAFTFRFTDGFNTVLHFMYNIDDQGIRLESLPNYAIEEINVTRRSASPMVMYFYRDSQY